LSEPLAFLNRRKGGESASPSRPMIAREHHPATGYDEMAVRERDP
jgi:hypothetical protein